MHTNDWGETMTVSYPLHDAASRGDTKLIKALLDQNRDAIFVKNEAGTTPLYVAAANGRAEAVRLFLASGSEVDAKAARGTTPLYAAAVGGHIEVVGLLLGAGAELNNASSMGSTPLHGAAANGRLEVVKLLLAKGANVKAQQENGAPVLYVAALNGRTEIVKLLLASGAEVNARMRDGTTPLFGAAMSNSADTAKVLLAGGAEVDARENSGFTPLYLAAQEGSCEVADLLLDSHADINSRGNKGGTPLHKAAERGHEKMVKLLLSRGAETDARQEKGWTPLYLAARSGKIEVGKLLLANKADIDAADNEGATPIYAAASNGHEEMALYLWTNHAKADPSTLKGHNDPHEVLQAAKNEAVQAKAAEDARRAALPFASKVDYTKNLENLPKLNVLRALVFDRAINGAIISLILWGVINLGAWLFLSQQEDETLRNIRVLAPPGTFDIYIYGGAIIGGAMLFFGLLGAATRTTIVGWLNGFSLVGVGIWNLVHDFALNDAVQPYGYTVDTSNPIWLVLGISQIIWGARELFKFHTLGAKPKGVSRAEKNFTRTKLAPILKAPASPAEGRLKFVLNTSQGFPFFAQKTESFTMWLLPDSALCVEQSFGQCFEVERAPLKAKKLEAQVTKIKGKQVILPIDVQDQEGRDRKLPLDSASIAALNEWLRVE